MTNHDELVRLYSQGHAWIEDHGLSSEAYDRMTEQGIRDAIWLFTNRVPMERIIRIMNSHPRAGESKLKEMREHEESKAIKAEVSSKRSKSISKSLDQAEMAAAVAKVSPSVLIAEIASIFKSEKDVNKLRCLFALMLQLHHAWQSNTDMKRATVESMSVVELRSIYLDLAVTVGLIREKVGTDTVRGWVSK